MPIRMKRSTEIVIPNGSSTVTGNSDFTNVIFEPYLKMAPACSTISTPSVATMRANGEARRSWRMINRCVSAPSRAQTSRPAAQATTTFWPYSSLTSHST